MATLEATEERARRARWPWALAWLAAALVLLRYAALLYADVRNDVIHPSDFHQYYQAALEIRQRGSLAALYQQYSMRYRPYDAADPAASLPESPIYPYPPFLAVLLLPFAWLGYPAARWLWLALNVALLGACLWLTGQAFQLRLPRPVALGLCLLAVVFAPIYSSLHLGQISLALLFLVLLGFDLERRGRPGWAGLALGLAALIKLFPGFLLVYYLARRRWAAVAAGAATVIVGGLVGLAVVGVESFRAYLEHVVPNQSVWYAGLFNVSFTGLFYRLLTTNYFTHPGIDRPHLAALLAGAASALALGGCAWLWWRWRAADDGLSYGLGILAMMLATPINGYYNLGFCFPVMAALGAFTQRAEPLPRGIYRLLLVAALLVALPVEFALDVGRGSSLARGAAAFQQTVRSGWLAALFPPSFYGLLLLGVAVTWGMRRSGAASGA